jgi:phosphoribosylglycinamide formyltransferase 1
VSIPVAVFASGGGTNLQALLDSELLAGVGHVALVISDRAGAGALERAAQHGVSTRHVASRGRTTDEIATEMLNALREHGVGFIALAGYLRLVPTPVIREFDGRIINIHPALLPAFGGQGMYGMHVHRAVLAAGCRVTGVTVHRVSEAYDEGRIVAQWPVPVLPGDSPESLAERVLAVEHVLYPAVLHCLLRGQPAEAAGSAAADLFRLTEFRTLPQTLPAEMLGLAGY